MRLGERLDLTNPVDRVRAAGVPQGYRFVDQYNRLWLRNQTGWQMTLGSENDKRPARTLTLYARSH